MPAKRDLSLDKYGIDKHAYRELYYFCLQYPRKKRRIAELCDPLRGVSYDGTPHGTGPGEPTAAAAERAAALSTDCDLIEHAAKEADPRHFRPLLMAVTRGESWRYLRLVKGLSKGEKSFRTVRRRFFYILAKEKGMI